MNKSTAHKLSYLSSLIMLNLGIAFNAAAADEAADSTSNRTISQAKTATIQEIEVISVSGIRGSLIRSKDIKKESGNIVDAITAEDIGKFPDQNVAESLQRITGVSIDRNGGEGQLISVRGLGPEFNSVLLNGRTIATTSGGRAFSFDILASELISGAEVHKTQSAQLQEGAIGATINVNTLKPLSIPGFKATGSVKGMYDEMTGDTKPQYSGLVSNTFADDTFGVLVSFAHSERKSRYDEANTAYYWNTDLTMDDGTFYENIYFPQNYDQIAQTESRKRTGGNLVLQYQPTENLTLTADALYSKYDVDFRQDILAHWFTKSQLTDVQLDENGTLTKLSMGKGSNSDFMVRQSSVSNTLQAFGFNADWQLDEDLKFSADISYSEAESDPKQGKTDTVASRPGDYTYDRSSGALLPTMSFDANNSTQGLKAGWGDRSGELVEDEILEVKFDGQWTIDAGVLASINFGAMYADRTIGSTSFSTKWPIPVIWGDNSSPVWLPESLFTTYNSDGFLSGSDGSPTEDWLSFNSEDFFNYLTSDAVIDQLDSPEETRALLAKFNGHQMQRDPEAYEVNEELKAFYTDFLFEGDLGTMAWTVTTGMRYVETQSTSGGNQIALLDLIAAPNEEGVVRAIESEDFVPVSVSNKYDNWLPSLNAKIELADDVQLRFAYSRSITRPELDEMSPLLSFGDGHVDNLSGTGSNPKLQPFASKNYDLSLEWYYDEGSYTSITAFRKDVDGYLETSESVESVTVPSGTYNYKISRPTNTNDAKIDGYEVAVQHMFTSLPAPFDGLGVIANMTFVDSESSADDPANPLPLIGLGDAQNLILFYEKDAVQFRIAYNNRDRFMQSKPRSWRGGHYVEDYGQVDISGSYDINEHFTVFFEGLNMTNELTIKTAEFKNQVLEVTETGPRYAVGIRGRF